MTNTGANFDFPVDVPELIRYLACTESGMA
jgi:hypothetical protein